MNDLERLGRHVGEVRRLECPQFNFSCKGMRHWHRSEDDAHYCLQNVYSGTLGGISVRNWEASMSAP